MLPDASIRRIFILRPDHLGDLVLFSGALRHIRERWPAAHITLCVRSYGLELFSQCPYVDRLVSFEWLRQILLDGERLPLLPKVRGSNRLSDWFRRGTCGLLGFPYRCDLALLPVLAPWAEYHRLLEQIPSRIRLGICGNLTNQTSIEDQGSRASYASQMDASTFPWNLPEIEATRRFLSFAGINVNETDLWPEFWTTTKDQSGAEEKISRTTNRITLGIAPGVTSIRDKSLPPEWFARAIRDSGMDDLRIVLLGSKADASTCAEVAGVLKPLACVESVLNLAGTTTVGELIECVRHCDAVLSHETATLHVANALRKPVLGIVGGGHFGRFYPWGNLSTAKAVYKKMDCYGCNWHCRYETIRCIQEIPAEAGARKLKELFQMLPALNHSGRASLSCPIQP